MLAVGNQDASEMVVCGLCCDVRGPWRHITDTEPPKFLQGCKDFPGDTERWPRFDFQTAVELCRVCGAVALPSGSRWALYQCEECKQRVMALNRRLGRCVIPIGRHSIMNGIFFDQPRSRSAGAVNAFAREMVDFARTHDGLTTWRREQIIRNLRECGLQYHIHLPLADYLAACARLPVDKEAAFVTLCREYYGVEPV